MRKDKLNPSGIEVLLNKLNECLQSEKFYQAEFICKKILELDPKYIPIFEVLGDLYLNSKNIKNAIEVFSRSIELNSNQANIFYKLGICYAVSGNNDKALDCYKKAIEIKADFYEAIYNAANLFFDLKDFYKSIEYFNKFIELMPTYPDAFLNKGLAYMELSLPQEAIASFNEAIKINPRCAEAYNNKGNALRDLNLFEEALESFNEAIKINPRYLDAISNRGVIYKTLKKDDLAIDDFKIANTREALFNLSLIYLSKLNFKDGWPLYKNRTDIQNVKYDHVDNESLITSKNILIKAEQGIGDQVLFLSALNYLLPFFSKISVQIDARLIPLFQRSYSEIKFISDSIKIDYQDYDKNYLSADILANFINDKMHLNNRRPFLKSNQIETQKIKEELNVKGKTICGISWRSQNNRIGKYKSIDLEKIAKILKIPDIVFINLQYGDTKNELEEAKEKLGVDIINYNSIDNTQDIDKLASLVDACDLVLTVSNFTAHLSGALGKKTYLMLPCASGNLWYWHSCDSISLWYPSIKIFHQKKFGDWEGVVAEISSAFNNNK